VGFEIIGEGCDGIGVAAVGHEQHATLIDVDEQRDVVVAASGGCFVNGDALDGREVGTSASGLDPMVDDAPQPGVVLLHEACRGSDRHGGDERHDEGLEQQREAGAGPCPRHDDLLDAAVGAGDASHAGVQEGLMLEEVEVPPLLHGRVVHRTIGRAALRTWEAAAPGEVDLDIEATLLGVEGAGLDHPRRDQPEGQLHQIGVAHRGVSRRPVEPRSCRRARVRQGVAWRRRARVELSMPAILDGRCARAPRRDGRSGRRDGPSIEQRDAT
jgi:hypothetical protein